MKLPIPRKESHSHRLPSERFDDFAATSARSVTTNRKHIIFTHSFPFFLEIFYICIHVCIFIYKDLFYIYIIYIRIHIYIYTYNSLFARNFLLYHNIGSTIRKFLVGASPEASLGGTSFPIFLKE